MGSAVTRHLRDLGDVGGFETLYGSDTAAPTPEMASAAETSTESFPATPTATQPVRVLEFDPRSPTAEIVRTPIEVASKFALRLSQDSPMSKVLQSRRSYLETDLDTLSTSESISKPDSDVKEQDSALPPGLSSAHLMKLRFLGIDPRSPSSDVARTPILICKKGERGVSPLHFDDTLSVGSVSSQDIFNHSLCSSEFTRDCSDPSAFISENEDMTDKEDEDESDSVQESIVKMDNALEGISLVSDAPAESLPKVSNKLTVFREVDVVNVEASDKAPAGTPEGTKRPTGNRARTPLTPIGNRNRTPNSILRAKQSQTIEKEILTKVKIYSTNENSMSPLKASSIGISQKENALGSARSSRKGLGNNENAVISSTKKRILAQWDQDNSVLI